ncbi:MAG: hypothetical protein SV062_13265 [Thermodesulfobacteriota bacterium]|nr:hypothetical protein [Thermodesulfobacteriota bacterium]
MQFKSAGEQKRLAVLCVVITAVIAFFLYQHFMRYGKKEISINKISSNPTTVKKKSEDRPYDSLKSTVKKMLSTGEWARDPFTLPPGTKLKESEEKKYRETKKSIKPYIKKKVTAILITDSQKTASINHKLVEVGDMIDGEKVLDIKPDRVILEKDGKRNIIFIERSLIKWSENEKEEHGE